MSKGRKPDKLRILSLLDGRRQIKRALNLSDKRYEDVRDELLREGLVEKYACRGGGLRLTRKGKKAASQSSAPATEEDEVVSWSTGTGFFVSASGHVLTNAGNVVGVVVSKLDALDLAMVTRDIPQLVTRAGASTPELLISIRALSSSWQSPN